MVRQPQASRTRRARRPPRARRSCPTQRRLARRPSSRTAAAPGRSASAEATVAPPSSEQCHSRCMHHSTDTCCCGLPSDACSSACRTCPRAVTEMSLDALAAACGDRAARPARRRRPPPLGVHARRATAESAPDAVRALGGGGGRAPRPLGPRRRASPLRRARRRAVRRARRLDTRRCIDGCAGVRRVGSTHARSAGVLLRRRRSRATHAARPRSGAISFHATRASPCSTARRRPRRRHPSPGRA